MTATATVHNTAVWQVVRGVGTWLLGTGVVLGVLLALQRDGDDWRGVLVFAIVVGVVGGTMMGMGDWQVKRLDALNRPLLTSPDAFLVMRGREAFDDRVIRARRWLLAALVLWVVVWVVVVTVQSCGETDHTGLCAWERPGDAWNLVLLGIGMVMGTAVGTLTLMHEAYQRESDRMGQIASDATTRRRLDDPLSGIGRGGWGEE